MSSSKRLKISDLRLDLNNFRTVPQKSESDSISAIIAIKPEWFWGLFRSILSDGYLNTENIIVLRQGKTYTVKEGNRRVGILKLLHGLMPIKDIEAPDEIKDSIKNVSAAWKKENATVPCVVYSTKETDKIDKIIDLTHGKGETAGRNNWEAVARARHARDKNGASEPALDLLETYLKNGTNITDEQRSRWSGDYHLTVLDEFIKKFHDRFGQTSVSDLVAAYPKGISHRAKLEGVLKDIGIKVLKFPDLRDKNLDVVDIKYGLPAPTPPAGPSVPTTPGSPPGKTPGNPKSLSGKPIAPPVGGKKGAKAIAIADPRAVKSALKDMAINGKDRQKIETLREEIIKLKLSDHPHAFCFLLRSMFELSAKAYCADYKSAGLSTHDNKGNDKRLESVLGEIVNHMTNNSQDRAVLKELHGAIQSLKTGLLSVTSLNQLIHNPKFSVSESHIATEFHNITPLLIRMNL